MDPSALIFVGLAVAWAVYLIPKALEHHEESVRTRTVDAFSDSMRVLARREPVSRREALLVAGDEPAPPTRREQRKADRRVAKAAKQEATLRRRNARRLARTARLPIDPRERRRAAQLAARRRLRVVTLLIAEIAVVTGVAVSGVIDYWWISAPVGLLVAWLIACRIMVRRERAAVIPVVRRVTRDLDEVDSADVVEDDDATDTIPAVVADPDAWDPVYAPLPTYVAKAVAERSVRTIDLDATGVWSSGHNESDSELVAEADEVAVVADSEPEREERRAAGS